MSNYFNPYYHKKENKYNAKKVTINEITFDSINESKFYLHCIYLLNRERKPGFELIKPLICSG